MSVWRRHPIFDGKMVQYRGQSRSPWSISKYVVLSMRDIQKAARTPDGKLRALINIPFKSLALKINNAIFKLMFNQAVDRDSFNDYLWGAVENYRQSRLPKVKRREQLTHLFVDLVVFEGMRVNFRLPLDCSVVLKALKTRFYFTLAL